MRLDIKLTKLIFRVAVSDKGWTDNEISVNWLRFFDDVTKEKVSGQYHLLVVDGHASHYCLKFIEYAQKHKIVILCYPAHATHVLQGLDVIIFAILKEAFSIERDKYNESHWPVKVTKKSFLLVLGNAWEHAITSTHIITSFCVTGVYPPDATVIRPEQLAPSIEHSTAGDLPLPVLSPV